MESDRTIDEQIRAAMEAGKFTDLPGKGKPLRLEENPYEPEEWRLAHHLLRSQGFSLPWIEIKKGIQEDLQTLRQRFRQRNRGQMAPSAEEITDFKAAIVALNRRIRDYNLQAPLATFQLRLLNADQELAALSQPD